MKIVIDIDNEIYGRIQALVNADYFEHDICGYSMQRIVNGTPYEEISQGECVEEIIDELESRKDYGAEYAQAMEDVIVILKAKFGVDKDRE